jgi:putative hydrolase of the HAD superfamily
MIKTLISDLGNVLLHFDHWRPCKSLSNRFGLNPNRIFEKFYGSDLGMAYELGRISSEEFGYKAIHELGLDLDIKEIECLWKDIFWPVEGMEDLIKSLKGKVKLILLSNTNAWHFEYCTERFSVVGLFEAYALSYRLGCRKPDLDIYRKALSLADTPPAQCLYVDDIPEYAERAKEIGMQCIRFEGVDPFKAELRKLGLPLAKEKP